MAVIDFPPSPTINQIHVQNDLSWIWTGTTWDIYTEYPNTPIHKVYNTLADMLNDQANQYQNFIYYVMSTNTYYLKLGTNTNSINDYSIINGNIYNSNGSLTDNRILSLSGNTLDISGNTITRYFPSGNIGINTITDNGYKLDISGTTRISSDLTIYPTNGIGDLLTIDTNNIVRKTTISEILPDIDAVPYTGATKNVDLGEYGIKAGYYIFDTTPTNTPTVQGTMSWDASKETIALIMNGTTQRIGQDLYIFVKNSTGSSIAKGLNVGFAGTDGASGHILIKKFLANGTEPSYYYIGVTSETINNGEFGQVMLLGELSGINTSGYSPTPLLYCSTTLAGAFQTTVPAAPNNIILVAAAINFKNNGEIRIRPTIGSNINHDEGVKIASPTNGQALVYNSTSGLWENGSISSTDSNKVSYNVADSKNATERNQARVNIGSTSATPQIIATAGAINDLTVTSNSLVFTGASVILSGIVAGLDGQEIAILNASGTNLELLSESVLSSANNRFASGVVVPNLSIVRIKYRTTTARWVLENVGINDGRYVRKDVDDSKSGFLRLINNKLFIGTQNPNDYDGQFVMIYPSSGTNGIQVRNASNAVVYSLSNNFSYLAGYMGINRNNDIFATIDVTPLSGFSTQIWRNSGGTNVAEMSTAGVLTHVRSTGTTNSVRRDELYLNYSQTVSTAGTINDLAINSDCKLLILTAATDLTGVVPVDNTRLLRIEARGGTRIIRNESTSSTAANRFSIGADLTMNDGEVYQFIYTNSRWRLSIGISSTSNSKWTLTGSDIYRDSAVAIGRTTIPNYTLSIRQTSGKQPLIIEDSLSNKLFEIQDTFSLATKEFVVDRGSTGVNASRFRSAGEITRFQKSDNAAVLTIEQNYSQFFHEVSITPPVGLTIGQSLAVRSQTNVSNIARFLNDSGITAHVFKKDGDIIAYGRIIAGGSAYGISLRPDATLQSRGEGTSTGITLLLEDSTGANTFEFLDNGNLSIPSTNGAKIGTSTTQKIGFFNATPISQPSGDILIALQNLGLINSPTISVSGGTGGTGTTNYVAKFTNSTTLGNSQIFDNGTNVMVNTTTDNGSKFQVSGTGWFDSTVTASNFITTSDIRLKTNIEKIENALDTLSKFSSYEYLKNGEKDAGFIAQEVEKILPYAVYNNNKGYLTMSDRPILAYIHKAILELKEEIDNIKKKL
jgi:hypothetical protein